MRKLFAGLAIVGLVALAGCHNTSATGGGSQSVGAGTFKFEAPKMATSVKHGSTETIKVTLNKKDFKEDIHLSVVPDDAAKDMKVDVDPKTIKAADPGEVNLKVTVGDKTPPGEYRIKVIGKPAKGESTEAIVPVKVPEKK
jgi:uncharacterized membrane protein